MSKYFVKILLLNFFLVATVNILAQTVRDAIRLDLRLAANSDMVYPEPHKDVTPAPVGYVPFYVTHYGRHGSSYSDLADTYEKPYRILTDADKAGALTPLGRDVLRRVACVVADAKDRHGELTPIGASQQRDIARRLVERFPEVFAGRSDVMARSVPTTSCILSMEYFMMQLAIMYPELPIHHNATNRDLYFLDQRDRHLSDVQKTALADERLTSYMHRQATPDRQMRLTRSLFSDMDYVSQHVDIATFDDTLFRMAASVQNSPLRDSLTLLDLFTADEAYRYWQKDNARWYVSYGNSPISGGKMPYTQRNLLRRMVHDADSCLFLPHPSLNLRFGPVTCVMPLVCLLDVNGFGVATDSLESLEQHGWWAGRIAPMGANLQLVFYHRFVNDTDVLFKVLLNEEEATLPLPAVQGPYYRWSDFRKYCLSKLDAYVE